MKIKILSLFSLLLVFALMFVLASCDDEQDPNQEPNSENLTDITTQDMISVNGVDTIFVENAVTSYNLASDFIPKISLNPGVESEFSANKDFSTKLGTVLNLNEGDNFIYLKVTDSNGNTNSRTFNIYRYKMFTVTFDPAGGTLVDGSTEKKDVKVEENHTTTAIGVERAGYKLVKWDYDFKNPITANVTVTALWVPNTYKITANVDGIKTEYSVEYGAVPSQLPTPDKSGYHFTGWKINNSNFDASAAYSYDRDIEIVAAFEVLTYNIQYILGYDEAVNSEKNPASFDITANNIELFAPVIESGYVFLGWYSDSSFNEDNKVTHITSDMAGKDVVLYAKWVAESSVTFDPNGGECNESSATYTFGDKYTLPIPTKANYVFDAWYNGTQRLENSGTWSYAGNVTLVAKWTPRQNTIEYVVGYEGATNNNPTSYDVEDGEVVLQAPTINAKHEFIGWYTDPNFAEESKIEKLTPETVVDEMNLYAKWRIVSTVTFVTGCDTVLDAQDIKADDAYEIPEVSKENYTFGGWFDENGNQVDRKGVWAYTQENVVLTAKWNETEYQVNYVVNGGELIGDYDSLYTLSTDFANFVLPTVNKNYAIFGGWYFDADFSLSFNADELLNYKGVTLYAKWNPIKVTVNYDKNGGSITAETEEFNLGENYVLLTPVKSGYVFVGWYMDDQLMDSEIIWTNGDVLELNLRAEWSEKKYSITYDLDGGSAEGLVNEYTVSSEAIKLPKPTKSGFHFVGWMKGEDMLGASVVINKGSTGDLAYKAVWTGNKDNDTGLLFSIVEGKAIVVGIDRVINNDASITDPIINGIKIPASFNGFEVVGIDSYAFKAFGEMFVNTRYANMSSSYVTFSVPVTVKKIGKDAFAGCNGIKVVLYDPDNARADYEFWDDLVVWESGNRPARDCIWGLRPAIGWTRYSRVPIPEGYDAKVPN